MKEEETHEISPANGRSKQAKRGRIQNTIQNYMNEFFFFRFCPPKHGNSSHKHKHTHTYAAKK